MKGASVLRGLSWLELRRHTLGFLGLVFLVSIASGLVDSGGESYRGFVYLSLLVAAAVLGAQGLGAEKVDGALAFRRALPLRFETGLVVQLAVAMGAALLLILLAVCILLVRGETLFASTWLLVAAGSMATLFLSCAASFLLPDGLSAVPAGGLGFGLWSLLLVLPQWMCWGSSAALHALVPGGILLFVGLPLWLVLQLPVWLRWSPAPPDKGRRRALTAGLAAVALLAWGLTLRPSLAVLRVRAGAGVVLEEGLLAGPRASVAYRVVDALGAEHAFVTYTDIPGGMERQLLRQGSVVLGWLPGGELLMRVEQDLVTRKADGRVDRVGRGTLKKLLPVTRAGFHVEKGRLEDGSVWIHGGES